MRSPSFDIQHAAGALTLVMPVASPVRTVPAAPPERALVVVLRDAEAHDPEVDDLLRTRRERELEATAALLERWEPTRVAIDTGLRGRASGDALQLATLLATRFGHRRLWDAAVSRDLDAPGLFRQRANARFGAREAAEWYARQVIVSTPAATGAEPDERLLVITAAGEGPMLRALLAPEVLAAASAGGAAPARRTAPRGTTRRRLAGAA